MEPCFVFDIDGTLAIGTHREWLLKESPKKWDVYFGLLHLDLVNLPVAEVCRSLHSVGKTIVYCTGRPEQYIPQTSQWLKDNSLPDAPLFYRKRGDYRDDSIIKLELIEEIEKSVGPISMLFDDRNRVVLAARSAGYTVAQVAPGDF